MSGGRSTVMFTTGPAGSGKSYRRCAHYLCREYLPDSEGQHISNFPIKFDPWRDGLGVEHQGLVAISGLDRDLLERRVERIPDDVLEGWRNAELSKYERVTGEGVKGPWDYFPPGSLAGVHLAIDEIHNFCGAKHNIAVRRRWQEWLGELRHEGATIEFLSQHPNKVATEIIDEAEVKLELIKGEQRRDPFFGIKLYDWYNLRAKWDGKWQPSCWQVEYRRVGGKWTQTDSQPFWFDRELYGVYDSFSAPVMRGGAGAATEKREYERFGWLRLVLWFLGRNLMPLCARGSLFAVIVICFFFRGSLIDGWFWAFERMRPNHVAAVAGKSPAPLPAVDARTARARLDTTGVDASGLTDAEAFKLARSLEEVERLRAEVVAITADRDSAVSVVAETEARLRQAFAVVAVTPQTVTFRAGYTYALGEQIDYGPFEGRHIATIDTRRRLVVLDDGAILRFGLGDDSTSASGWLSKQLGIAKDKAKASQASGVQEPLRPTQPGPAQSNPVNRTGKADFGQLPGNAPSGVQPMVGAGS